MLYVNELDRKRISDKMAKGLPLTSYERGLQCAMEADAKEAGKRIGAVARQEAQAVADANTPEHLRRPRNVPAELLAKLDTPTYFKDARTKRRIAELTQEAAAENARIDALMGEKAKAHAVATDPAVVDALKHCDRVAGQFPDLAAGLTEARGLLTGGGAACVPTYYERVSTLLAGHRAKTADAVAEAGKVLSQAEIEYGKRQADLERAEGLRQSTSKGE